MESTVYEWEINNGEKGRRIHESENLPITYNGCSHYCGEENSSNKTSRNHFVSVVAQYRMIFEEHV